MAPVKTSPRLSHAALRQFYISWDGLSHEGKLRQLGNKIGDDKISAVIFASPGLPSSLNGNTA